jgi:hypothetical protein
VVSALLGYSSNHHRLLSRTVTLLPPYIFILPPLAASCLISRTLTPSLLRLPPQNYSGNRLPAVILPSTQPKATRCPHPRTISTGTVYLASDYHTITSTSDEDGFGSMPMRLRRQQPGRGSSSISYAMNSRVQTHITHALQMEALASQSPICRSFRVCLRVVFQSDHRFSKPFAVTILYLPLPKRNAISCLIQFLWLAAFKTKLIQWIVHYNVAFDQFESRVSMR